MKLDVNVSGLELAAAKMQGLDAYLTTVRQSGVTYRKGLALVKQFAKDNHGQVSEEGEDGVTRIVVGKCVAFCYQPYPDIDRFYFES